MTTNPTQATAGPMPHTAAPGARWAALLKRVHRLNAVLVGLFLLAHLGNHLLALAGPDAHIRAMTWLRHAYRQPAVEVLLLAGVAVQTLFGLRFLQLGALRKKGVGRLQAYSGAYLTLFLAIHLAAIAWGRTRGLDTNFYFAAAGLHIAPYPQFFVPYYFLAVLAVFAHLACALHRLLARRMPLPQRQLLVWVGVGTGAIVAALIVAAFAGLIHPVLIPAAYQASYS